MKNYKTIQTVEDFNNLIDKMSLLELKNEYFQIIQYFNKVNNFSRIYITKEQFDAVFVVRGMSEPIQAYTGAKRGRKPTIITEEDKEAQKARQREYQRKRYLRLKEHMQSDEIDTTE